MTTSAPDSIYAQLAEPHRAGSAREFLVCQASLPDNPRVQRRVLVTCTDRPQSTVDVISYRMPVR